MYHYVGLVLSESIGESLRVANISSTESKTFSAKIAVPGAIIFAALGFWLLLKPWIGKLITTARRRTHDKRRAGSSPDE